MSLDGKLIDQSLCLEGEGIKGGAGGFLLLPLELRVSRVAQRGNGWWSMLPFLWSTYWGLRI